MKPLQYHSKRICITDLGCNWYQGTIAGHKFQALVFAGPAMNREWEVNGDSRISKLWVQHAATKKMVYNWDRGADLDYVDGEIAMIVEFLATNLANHIYGAVAVEVVL